MPYQYRREPLTLEEANWLANACETHEEKLVVWTLLDTGLRVSEPVMERAASARIAKNLCWGMTTSGQ